MQTTITVQHTISMGHRLPSYDGICSSPHGHNVRVEVEIRVAPDTFTDFKEVQDILRKILEPMDHAMVLHKADPLLPTLQSAGFRTVTFSTEPTTEQITQHVFWRVQEHYPSITRCTVHETDKYSATMRRD